ncbi:MAG: hypothetical protein Q8868_14370, partial [Bacteroidota bacterium]|nr:hypothetical protein [Bacteroidota bacterium]
NTEKVVVFRWLGIFEIITGRSYGAHNHLLAISLQTVRTNGAHGYHLYEYFDKKMYCHRHEKILDKFP